MSKQIPDLMQIQKNEVSNDDLMVIRDVSENRDKKGTVGDIIGRPREGWLSILADTWVFASYNGSSKIGVVNVNEGALALYSVGMRVKFVQGVTVKYGVIVGQTNTSLSIFMLDDVALADATIETIQVSQSFAPQTDAGTNFFGTLLTGQIDGLPVMLAVKNQESDPDVPAQPGFVILEAILGDEV